jgi:hypothetical protein
MGPLVPFIIGNEFNLVIALLVGIGFGFILEQAGFSSTKKLVGLFYGYDFTVLKVFFTAGVTAMIGVLLLSHLGLLNLSLIYINPTFLWSALIGGAIMGIGFIIGGFCPGTSVCAAAIGKLDALAFVFGSALGVFVFIEGYPAFEKIYIAEAWGPVLINEKLGLSKIVFGLILSAVAFGAFYITSHIENHVNGVKSSVSKKKAVLYSSAIGFAFLTLLFILIIPDRQNTIEARISRELTNMDFSGANVPADKLANEIITNYYKINIIDVRTPEEFKNYHLPFAINIPIDKMNESEWKKILNQTHKTNYFYSDDAELTNKAYLKAEIIGKADNFILTESSSEFRKMFFELNRPMPDASKKELNTYNFRNQAAVKMMALVDALKNSSQPVVAKVSKVKGGC